MARRAGLTTFLIIVMLALPGCQVRPLYAPGPVGHDAAGELASIDVAPVEGRAGQLVRNKLVDLLHAGGAAHTSYQLGLSVRQREQSSIVRRVDGEPTQRNLTLVVTYTLTRLADGNRVVRGRVSRAATFQISRQQFANERAALDATERAAREAAEEIRMRLAAFFASGGVMQAHMSPDVPTQVEVDIDGSIIGDGIFED